MFRARLAARIARPGCAGGCRFFSATGGSRFPGAEKPKIVAPTEPEAETVGAALDRLLSVSGRGRWSLTTSGDGIERSFQFKTFTKTWDFMTAVALQCKLKNHHPEWSNVYNTTFVRWTTHSPTPGLTRRDTELAALCDALARDFGEITVSSGEGIACSLQDLANKATTVSGGNCCTPGKGANQKNA
ncbi:pterin-4-alpha-carbinolamine dehydratase [Grosmannia clavigera kw1407]|uniref:4a-hydroxytetrahydrobiopterin dehydratase n=1 Tax=Grosmannia clavigera (strain kw1407 / UAMH 11150) TaxID=655863 RepID=F0XHW2_GROCL|nr:pterin-4-alpha-carbinolamine dehydratase [Grosmannia clavigera kw1407]EFX03320.1 pterin-4-alpha-carbinolamine dehydratase [Grosmannia clavigera kw1407]